MRKSLVDELGELGSVVTQLLLQWQLESIGQWSRIWLATLLLLLLGRCQHILHMRLLALLTN